MMLQKYENSMKNAQNIQEKTLNTTFIKIFLHELIKNV